MKMDVPPRRKRACLRKPPRYLKHETMLSLFLAVCASQACVARAVQTSFSHYFTFENSQQVVMDDSDDGVAGNATEPKMVKPDSHETTKKSSGIRRDNYGSPGAMVRWNSFTILPAFGMKRGARVELEISNLTYTFFPAHYAPTQPPVVFALYDVDQWRAYAVLHLRDMPLKSPTILCHYPSAMRYTLTERAFNIRRNTTVEPVRVAFDVKKPSSYTLQVQVCGDASVFVAGRASMVNRRLDNGLTEHLAVGELGLITVYEVMIVIYCMFTMLWIVEGYLKRKTTAKLSHVFQLALHFKTLESFIKLWYYRELSQHGQRDTTFKIVRDISESAASAILLCVMLLAALGWSLTRDHLSVRERRFMGAGFLFYFIIATIKATCSADAEDICKAYMLTEYLIKSIMMLGVIVALNFTISQLRLALNEARWNNYVSPLMYMKLNQFQGLRLVFLGYLLLPTTLLIVDLVVINPPGLWRYDWVNDFLSECSTLVIFASIAINLRSIDTYVFSQISRGTNPGGPTTRHAPPSPDSPIPRNAIVPEEIATTNLQGDQPRSAAEQAIESNRRLLRDNGASSPDPIRPTTPTTPPPPPSRRGVPAFSPMNLMLSPSARHL